MFNNDIAAGAAVGLAGKRAAALRVAHENAAEAQRIIDAQHAEIQRLSHLLRVEQALNIANIARGNAFKDELKAVDPENKLFQSTESIWTSGEMKGKPKSRIRRIFERAFDLAARERKISDATTARGD